MVPDVRSSSYTYMYKCIHCLHCPSLFLSSARTCWICPRGTWQRLQRRQKETQHLLLVGHKVLGIQAPNAINNIFNVSSLCVYICIYIFFKSYIHGNTCTCTYIYISIYLSINLSMYVYIYIYMHATFSSHAATPLVCTRMQTCCEYSLFFFCEINQHPKFKPYKARPRILEA